MTTFKNILVPTDFSPSAQRATELAIEMAKRFDASLTLLHVVEIPVYTYDAFGPTADLLTPVQSAAETMMAALRAEVQAQVPRVSSEVRLGRPADEILAAIETTGADLVVIGTHGRRGVRRLLMGSVAERVVRFSTVPVLTAHGAP